MFKKIFLIFFIICVKIWCVFWGICFLGKVIFKFFFFSVVFNVLFFKIILCVLIVFVNKLWILFVKFFIIGCFFGERFFMFFNILVIGFFFFNVFMWIWFNFFKVVICVIFLSVLFLRVFNCVCNVIMCFFLFFI